MLYYLQDEEGNLVEFIYDNNVYYYTKTMNDDYILINNAKVFITEFIN